MKKILLILALACSMTNLYASWIPIPNCVDGKWQIGGRWVVTQSQPCVNDQEIRPGKIFGKYVNPHDGTISMTVKFYDAKEQLAVTMQTHGYMPWGGSWTGPRRVKLAYCPSETGKTTIDHCPII